MLDHLKKDRQVGFAAQERLKLSLYVAGMLILGLVIYAGATSKRAEQRSSDDAEAEGTAAPVVGPLLDPAELGRLVADSGLAPGRWAAPGVEYVRRIQRTGRVGPVIGRVTTQALWTRGPEDLRGRVVEVSGRVLDVSREQYRPEPDASGSGRLWSVVLEGEDGATAVGVSYALASEVDEGPPTDTKPPRVKSDRIAPGHWVLLRGVYLQQRTGTVGETQLKPGTPALFATSYRIVMPPDQRNPLVSTLDDALWSEVRDRFNRESRRWEEDAVYETIQWARAEGYEAVRKAILEGDLGWTGWGRERFDAWKDEVAVDDDRERPLTEGSRGKVFRLSGVVGEVLQYGWERIPRNPWGVDQFQVLTMLSDHYRNVALRLILPFPIDTFEGVEGNRKDHLRVYGVFVKNLTYDTKFKSADGDGRPHPVTVPMFVVLHAETFPDDAAGEAMREMMLWVAAAMVLFGLLFYFVLIRGGSRQDRRMDEHRLALRRRMRAKGQGHTVPTAPVGGRAPAGGDSEPGGAGPGVPPTDPEEG